MKSRQRGFTLIELMIVVGIIGILAAVATPVFIRYIKKSRTSEATTNLRMLFDRVHQYHTVEHHTFPPDAPPTPAASCCTPGGNICTANPADWNTPTWSEVGFSMIRSHYYHYEIVSNNGASPPEFHAYAYGDLDCDGTTSTFEISGYVQDNDVVMVPLKKTRPLE